jgi:hypothetical protein
VDPAYEGVTSAVRGAGYPTQHPDKASRNAVHRIDARVPDELRAAKPDTVADAQTTVNELAMRVGTGVTASSSSPHTCTEARAPQLLDPRPEQASTLKAL